MKFRSFLEEVDLVPYVLNFLMKNPTTYIMVGTDSLPKRLHARYATVVILYIPNKGGHVLYHDETIQNAGELHQRLWVEVEKTIQVVGELIEGGVPRELIAVHFDINPNPAFKSNVLHQSAIGFAQGMGIHPDKIRTKPDAAAATYMADSVVRS